jgi:hypothetical protein
MTFDLRDLLPAGEWENVQILRQQRGLMAKKAWAVFAKARRVRDGGGAAYIKFIVEAGPEAGDSTILVTDRNRLDRLYERLRRIQRLEGAIPVVPLLEVQRSENGLLIAMGEVTPLRELIEKGEAYHLSARVLADLDPDEGGNGWHHFDVCPDNIGVLPSGRCVLIDVESLYLETEGKYDISTPAWKPFRAPGWLVQGVGEQLQLGEIDKAVAARKLRYEIALAAAECVLGPITYRAQNLDRSTIDAWVAGADPADPAVVFWRQELLAAIQAVSFPALRQLRERLESAIGSGAGAIDAPLVQAPTGGMEPEQPVEVTSSAAEPAPAQPGWLEEWALVLPMVHALRAGKLGAMQIVEYREALQQIAARYPTQADVWNELLLVVISYEKDAGLALSVVNEAHKKIPDDDGLARMKNIVEVWARGRQYGGQ